MLHRHLDLSEIATLESQGCTSADWHHVRVKDPFRSDTIERVQFSGDITLGVFNGYATFPCGLKKPTGLRNCSIHNCTIGDNVLVENVAVLANYDIETGVVLENVGTLAVEGTTAFGNGTTIEVLNEGGGRELPITERLSAQTAYLLTMYRHRPALVSRLEALIADYVSSRTSDRGLLEHDCRISNCATVVNVAVGPYARIEGAVELRDGSVRSCAEDPAVIGHGVIAREFILLSGSHLQDGALLTRCFVGQGVRIGRQFSAENSAFFANCEGFHGEACSVFAGPYTVTHHKSTLLIAGQFSFYNAGSGTNQSNHMYKLGPLHQGIMERGSKTGSLSYMLWPCRVGPFSVVLEKHSANFDATNLPFSYINVENGKSLITPAMNLFTVGTRRDAAKWPKRDRRKDPEKLDQIHFDLFSPYVMGKVLKGIAELKALAEKTPKERNDVVYNGAIIKRLMLQTACKYYELAVNIFLGRTLVEFLGNYDVENAAETVRNSVAEHDAGEVESWVDMAGLMAPARVVEALTDRIESGEVPSVNALLSEFETIHSQYGAERWRWFSSLLASRLGGSAAITIEHLIGILENWKTSAIKLNNMVAQDAAKEFDPTAQIGFGHDGDADVRRQDFEAVRGTVDGCGFIAELKEETRQTEEQCRALTERLLRPASA